MGTSIEVLDITDRCVTKELPEHQGQNLYGVYYGDILLWTHIYSAKPKEIDGYKIAIYDETATDNGVTIIGKVPVASQFQVFVDMFDYDYTHYGYWDTVEEALNWLENPVEVPSVNPKTIEILEEISKFFFGESED